MCANKRVPLVVAVQATVTCPCCQHTIETEAEGIGFDYMRGELFKDKVKVRLTEQEADIFQVLLNHWPKLASMDEILNGVYGAYLERPLDPRSSIAVPLSTMRRKIEEVGLAVKNFKGRGWALIAYDEAFRFGRKGTPLSSLLSRHVGEVVKYQDIYEHLWGDHPPPSDEKNLVNTRARKLRRKPGWKLAIIPGVGVRVNAAPKGKKN